MCLVIGLAVRERQAGVPSRKKPGAAELRAVGAAVCLPVFHHGKKVEADLGVLCVVQWEMVGASAAARNQPEENRVAVLVQEISALLRGRTSAQSQKLITIVP